MPDTMQHGEKHAWDILAGLVPEDVCRRAAVEYDHSKECFRLRIFSRDIFISVRDRHISGGSVMIDSWLERLTGHARLSALWYLISARDVPFTGKLVKPGEMGGGDIYERGTHVLPLDVIAEKYGSDVTAFLESGRELGGEQEVYGDASIRLTPFPRVQVVLLLWKRDTEFAARAGLLFDSSIKYSLPVDIIWSTAMMSLLAML